jgi:hypothetical protein
MGWKPTYSKSQIENLDEWEIGIDGRVRPKDGTSTKFAIGSVSTVYSATGDDTTGDFENATGDITFSTSLSAWSSFSESNLTPNTISGFSYVGDLLTKTAGSGWGAGATFTDDINGEGMIFRFKPNNGQGQQYAITSDGTLNATSSFSVVDSSASLDQFTINDSGGNALGVFPATYGEVWEIRVDGSGNVSVYRDDVFVVASITPLTPATAYTPIVNFFDSGSSANISVIAPGGTGNYVDAVIPSIGTLDFSPRTLIIEDENKIEIEGTDKIKVSYSTDGSGFSAFFDMEAFKTIPSSLFTNVGVVRLRIQPVGIQKFSTVSLGTATSEVLLNDSGNIVSVVDGDTKFVAQNGVVTGVVFTYGVSGSKYTVSADGVQVPVTTNPEDAMQRQEIETLVSNTNTSVGSLSAAVESDIFSLSAATVFSINTVNTVVTDLSAYVNFSNTQFNTLYAISNQLSSDVTDLQTNVETYINTLFAINNEQNADIVAISAGNIDLTNYSGDIIPSIDDTYSLGASGKAWKDLYVSGNSIYMGDSKLTVNEGTLNIDGIELGRSLTFGGGLSESGGTVILNADDVTIGIGQEAVAPEVKLLLTSETTNGSTVFSDLSTSAHTVNPSGSVQHSTEQSKFGSSSIKFDGVDSFLYIPDSSDFDFGSDDLTIESWIYFDGSLPLSRVLFYMQRVDAYNKIWFAYEPQTFGLEFGFAKGGVNWFAIQNSTAGWSANTWYHIAATFNSGIVKLFRDGQELYSADFSPGLPFPSLNADINMGRHIETGIGSDFFNGYMEDFRITKGTSLYNGSFTPPSSLGGGSTVLQIKDNSIGLEQLTQTAIDTLSASDFSSIGENITPQQASTYNIGTQEIPFKEAHINELHLEPLSGGQVPVYEEGLLFFDGDNKVLKLYNDVEDVALDVGEENWVRIVNKTGSTIPNGGVVYINGAQGNRPTVALADANFESSDKTIGIATHDILDNQQGYVTTFGLVRELNTSTYTEGDILYLSTTPGEFTKTPPSIPIHKVRVGYVVTSHVTQGVVFVHVDSESKIDELHDVSISSVQDGQLLSYNTSLSAWVNVNGDQIDLSSISQDIIPSADATYSLGTSANKWKDLHVSSNTIFIDNIPVSVIGNELAVNGTTLLATDSYTFGDGLIESAGTISFNPDGVTLDFDSVAVDSNVKLLITSEDVDGSTTFVDSSTSSHTITPNGVTHSTDTAKFGNSSIKISNNNYLIIPDSDDFHLTPGDFTIECWVNLTNKTTPSLQPFVVQAEDSNSYYSLRFNSGSGLQFSYSNNGVGSTVSEGSVAGWANNTWYHVAVSVNSEVVKIYKDGVEVGSSDWSGVGASYPLPNFAGTVIIGYLDHFGTDYYLTGYLEDIRITKNVGTYTTNFTPPTSLYIGAPSVMIKDAGIQLSHLSTETYAALSGGGGGPIDLSSVDQNIIPAADETYSLGTSANKWKDLYVSSNTIFIGTTSISVEDGRLKVGDAPVAQATTVVKKSANYTLVDGERTALVTTGASDITITLPTALTTTYPIVVKKIDSGSGKVIVKGNGTQVIYVDGVLDGNTYDVIGHGTSITLEPYDEGGTGEWYVV